MSVSDTCEPGEGARPSVCRAAHTQRPGELSGVRAAATASPRVAGTGSALAGQQGALATRAAEHHTHRTNRVGGGVGTVSGEAVASVVRDEALCLRARTVVRAAR